MSITENELDAWVRGNARGAQGVIVELVWRLVAVSSPKPKERRFPLGDSIGQHGPDGILDVELPFDPFVPEGRSFWEIGTGLQARDKATADYSYLVATLPEQTRRAATFVFVTPLSGSREWEHTWKENAQADWIEKRRSHSDWKDVRVIDGTKLIDWLHHFPAVGTWLAREITGVPVSDIETVEQHWDHIREIGDAPPLAPILFLANRDEASTKLHELLSDVTVQLRIDTHYPDQVVDFVSAHVAALDDERRAEVAGKCLVISGANAWQALAARKGERHILIAGPPLDLSGEAGTKLIQMARRAGHAVIFGGPQGGPPGPLRVALPTPRIYHVQEALETAGYGRERARSLAQKSGGNLGSLLRCLQGLSLMPQWAESSAAAEITIAEMVGSWSEESSADLVVVETLSENSYGEWIGKVREIALRPGTPLVHWDSAWRFAARYEGWYALGPQMYDVQLDRLRIAATTVLREPDPRFTLPAEERPTARIYGKDLAHSRLLRNGLAETLALLGAYPEALVSCTTGKPETTAVLAVRAILADADWVRWASLNDVLPLLAEAAPSEFLSAVEGTLNRAPCPFDELFAQEEDGLFGASYVSGLLWALETLAWDASFFGRAVMCLGELATREPGGRWANRSLSSLTTILLPWLPQTCAPIARRGTIVKTMLDELPDIGWKLVLRLLPRSQQTSTGSRRPAWREFIPDDWSQGVTHGEYGEQVSLYSDLAITAAKTDRAKLSELIGHLDELHQAARDKLLGHLGSASVLIMPEADRLGLWTELVDLMTKHRKFSDAAWAMPLGQVDVLTGLADRLAPTDPMFRYQRLFSEREFDLYEETGDWKEQQKALNERRRAAVQEVMASGRLEAVLAFATAVESPWRVGLAFGVAAESDIEARILPDLLEAPDNSLAQFAGGFVLGRFLGLGWQWVDRIDTAHWTPGQIGQFLSHMPFTTDTWARSARLLGEDESAYWSKASTLPFEGGTDLELAVDKLLRYGRPLAALRCVHQTLHVTKRVDGQRTVRALISALSSSESVHGMDAYETVEIIKALQSDPNTDVDNLFQVEWAYLPLLDRRTGTTAKTLERRLADDAAFFCEVLRLLFKSEEEEPPTEERLEQAKSVASNAYRLLHDWRYPPGSREDGMYDGEALATWLAAVKQECADTGLSAFSMTMVGHALVYVPPDPDGLWIHRAAAAALNAKDAGDMRDGFRTELFNSRWVHLVENGGHAESVPADKYRSQADAVDDSGYRYLAASLRELVGECEREAERVSSRDPLDW